MVGKPIFSLWAKFELTADELALIDRYKVRKTVLFPGNPNDIRKAARYAALVLLVAYVVLAFEAASALVEGRAGEFAVVLNRTLNFKVCLRTPVNPDCTGSSD